MDLPRNLVEGRFKVRLNRFLALLWKYKGGRWVSMWPTLAVCMNYWSRGIAC